MMRMWRMMRLRRREMIHVPIAAMWMVVVEGRQRSTCRAWRSGAGARILHLLLLLRCVYLLHMCLMHGLCGDVRLLLLLCCPRRMAHSDGMGSEVRQARRRGRRQRGGRDSAECGRGQRSHGSKVEEGSIGCEGRRRRRRGKRLRVVTPTTARVATTSTAGGVGTVASGRRMRMRVSGVCMAWTPYFADICVSADRRTSVRSARRVSVAGSPLCARGSRRKQSTGRNQRRQCRRRCRGCHQCRDGCCVTSPRCRCSSSASRWTGPPCRRQQRRGDGARRRTERATSRRARGRR
jgi:hypothetical protein